MQLNFLTSINLLIPSWLCSSKVDSSLTLPLTMKLAELQGEKLPEGTTLNIKIFDNELMFSDDFKQIRSDNLQSYVDLLNEIRELLDVVEIKQGQERYSLKDKEVKKVELEDEEDAKNYIKLKFGKGVKRNITFDSLMAAYSNIQVEIPNLTIYLEGKKNDVTTKKEIQLFKEITSKEDAMKNHRNYFQNRSIDEVLELNVKEGELNNKVFVFLSSRSLEQELFRTSKNNSYVFIGKQRFAVDFNFYLLSRFDVVVFVDENTKDMQKLFYNLEIEFLKLLSGVDTQKLLGYDSDIKVMLSRENEIRRSRQNHPNKERCDLLKNLVFLEVMQNNGKMNLGKYAKLSELEKQKQKINYTYLDNNKAMISLNPLFENRNGVVLKVRNSMEEAIIKDFKLNNTPMNLFELDFEVVETLSDSEKYFLLFCHTVMDDISCNFSKRLSENAICFSEVDTLNATTRSYINMTEEYKGIYTPKLSIELSHTNEYMRELIALFEKGEKVKAAYLLSIVFEDSRMKSEIKGDKESYLRNKAILDYNLGRENEYFDKKVEIFELRYKKIVKEINDENNEINNIQGAEDVKTDL